MVYVSAERDLLRAFALEGGGVLTGAPPGEPPRSFAQSKCPNSHQGMPGGFLSLSAKGGVKDTAIIWASMPRWNLDALHHVVPGVLRAYRAFPEAGSSDLTELWNSDQGLEMGGDCGAIPVRYHEDLFFFAKGASPTIARGRVYLPTFSDELLVYGLGDGNEGIKLAATQELRGALSVTVPSGSFAPGSSIPLAFTAKNTGSKPWKAHQLDVRCRRFPGDPSDSQDGAGAPGLPIPTDVPPGGAFSAAASVVAARDEGAQYFRCSVALLGGAAHPTLPGESSADISLMVLRPDCANLRSRTDAIVAQFRAGTGLPAALQAPVERLRTEANARGCYLGMDAMVR